MASRTRAPMTPMRKTAVAAGVFYLLTFVTSIPALPLYDDVLNDPAFVLGAGSATAVTWGAYLEIFCGLTCIATAVYFYRVLRRHSESAAIGFVAARTLEAAMIFAGAVSVLAVVALRQDPAAAADSSSIVGVARGLVAFKDQTFLIGPGVMPAINALFLAPVLYRARLVPRWLPTLGMVAAPILIASTTATLFGAYEQVSGPSLLAAIPIAVWEFSLGVYLVVKGFKPSSAINLDAPARSDYVAA